MSAKSAKPRLHSAEDDLAFMRSIVEGSGRPPMTLAICYLAGGLLYGLQCLFHVGQATGLIDWPDLANLAFVDPGSLGAAKLGVLSASLIAAVLGLTWGVWSIRRAASATRASSPA